MKSLSEIFKLQCTMMYNVHFMVVLIIMAHMKLSVLAVVIESVKALRLSLNLQISQSFTYCTYIFDM